MTKDGVAVDSRLAAAVAAKAHGERLNVAAECASLGVSRQTFYKYLARFRADGVQGLFPRSRAPIRHSSETSATVCEAVIRARKELDDAGADIGAISIRWRLEAQQVTPLPSRATVHRILVRHGLVTAQPKKRPKASTRRFAAPFPNAMWQLDAFQYQLATGRVVWVIQILDDCSRLDLADRAAPSENGVDVWAAVETAAGRYGLPVAVLTDNGSSLNGSRRGFTTDLERRLRGLGVTPIATSIDHPQCNGKNERVHKTAQRWLRKQPPAADLPQLQALLDTYRNWYNTQRRHQGIGGLTPRQRWDLAGRARPNGTPIPQPPLITHPRVSPRGAVQVDSHEVALAKRHAGQQATVFRVDDHVTVFIGSTLIRTLEIDRSRDYQPSGIKPPGGSRRR
ncbi:MAG: IS481 family transposase [Propionibacteriales bacterium]|nr:IS481 family transposase [Propionibacteriales bacterium]